jgi:glycosyltransferase involved in cell wall biosynthesis
MNNTLLSVIIPTKNRYFTLDDLVKYFLTCDLDNIEIVIEDNSDQINGYIKELNNSHIKYYHSTAVRSMVANCELAVSRASGKFIVMLGDDDGIDLNVAKELIAGDKFDFYLSTNCIFYWPGLNRRIYGKTPFGFESKYIIDAERTINPRLELEKVISIGGVDILTLPRLYQGIVRRSCLEKVKIDHGHYFNAPMPDMSSSVALSLYCDIGYIHNKPFIVNGASSNSGGGLGAQGKHVGKLENAYGLTAQQLVQWPSEVPQFWCGGTVWSASLITTLRNLGADDLLNGLNRDYIYSHIIAYHFPQYYSINGFQNLRAIHFFAAIPIYLRRFTSLLMNIGLYTKFKLGYGVKCDRMSDYLRVFNINR